MRRADGRKPGLRSIARDVSKGRIEGRVQWQVAQEENRWCCGGSCYQGTVSIVRAVDSWRRACCRGANDHPAPRRVVPEAKWLLVRIRAGKGSGKCSTVVVHVNIGPD